MRELNAPNTVEATALPVSEIFAWKQNARFANDY
jgi:hypothetical protein